MLINPIAPPVPGFSYIGDTAALCPNSLGDISSLCGTGVGLGGDPFGITDVLGIVSTWINARKQEKIQKQQIGVEQAALKQQKVVNAESFAAQQAADLAAPAAQARKDQTTALILVGVAAVVIAGIFIYGATKNVRTQ